MNDFAKEKVAYVIGLLAVLFTLTPFLDTYGQWGFALFDLRLTLRDLYAAMAGTLSIAVYFYGLQFLTQRQFRYLALAGDVFYALGIAAPALFLTLFVGSSAASLLTSSPAAQQTLQIVVSAISTATALIVGLRTRAALQLLQRRSDTQHRHISEIQVLDRARHLVDSGHHDLAVVEAFKAIELAARDLRGPRDRGKRGALQWIDTLQSKLEPELRLRLNELRRSRNDAVHSAIPLTREAALRALETTNKVLAAISSGLETTSDGSCPECGSTDFREESGSDHGFHWTRRVCNRCGWLDLS